MRSTESRLLAGLALVLGMGLVAAGMLINWVFEAELQRALAGAPRPPRPHALRTERTGGSELSLSAPAAQTETAGRSMESLERAPIVPAPAPIIGEVRTRVAWILLVVFGVILLGAVILTRIFVAAPLRRLLASVSAFNQGDPHALIPIRTGRSDLERLGLQINRLLNAAASSIGADGRQARPEQASRQEVRLR